MTGAPHPRIYDILYIPALMQGIVLAPDQSDIDRGDAQPHEQGRYILRARHVREPQASGTYMGTFATRADLETVVARAQKFLARPPVWDVFWMSHCPRAGAPHYGERDERSGLLRVLPCCTQDREFATARLIYADEDLHRRTGLTPGVVQ